MNLDLVIPNIIEPALGFLVPSMDSRAARAMLIAIGLQESRFEHRFQINGPARSYWQAEKFGGMVHGVLTHPATKVRARDVLVQLDYPAADESDVYEAIAHNDPLACALARLLLWTLKDPLPAQGEYDEAWQQYFLAWRPGKPHRATWNGNYQVAWDMVEEG